VIRMAVLVLLLVVPFVMPESAHATSSTDITVTTVSHGIKLTLVVPGGTYPRNALVKLTVVVQNVSHYAVLTRLGPQCETTNNPSIEVSNGKGQLTPQLPSIMHDGRGCGVTIGLPLMPRQSELQHVVAVLSGAYVRAVLYVGRYLAKGFRTPRGQIHLTTGTALIATLHPSNIGPYATVQRPSGAKGPLYFVESALCGSPAHPQGKEVNLIWSPTLFDRIYSGCAGTQDWHGLVGYLNYPVATINYRSREFDSRGGLARTTLRTTTQVLQSCQRFTTKHPYRRKHIEYAQVSGFFVRSTLSGPAGQSKPSQGLGRP
jgi:hypothetical protein